MPPEFVHEAELIAYTPDQTLLAPGTLGCVAWQARKRTISYSISITITLVVLASQPRNPSLLDHICDFFSHVEISHPAPTYV